MFNFLFWGMTPFSPSFNILSPLWINYFCKPFYCNQLQKLQILCQADGGFILIFFFNSHGLMIWPIDTYIQPKTTH